MRLGWLTLTGFLIMALLAAPANAESQDQKKMKDLMKDGSKQVKKVISTKEVMEKVSEYKDRRDEFLKKWGEAATVPPKNASEASARKNHYNVQIVIIKGDIDKIMLLTSTPRSGSTTTMTKDMLRMKKMMEEEQEQWETFSKPMEEALEVQETAFKTGKVLSDAVGDTPKKTKALVDELKDVEGELDKVSGEREEKALSRRKQLISTVVGNVQSAWQIMKQSAKDLKDKKKFKPKTLDDRITPVSNTLNLLAQDPKVPEEFKKAAAKVVKGLQKTSKDYKETYTKAIGSLEPIITGKAFDAVQTFKGVKPDQISIMVMDRFEALRPK